MILCRFNIVSTIISDSLPMTEKPHSIIMKLASKYPLRRQLILLIVIVFTILGAILFISLSKLTQASIFHEIPMVEIEPIYSVEQNPGNPTEKSNPTIPVDLESVQSLALLQLQSKLQKILGITVSGALAVGLILAIWLSAFITTPIKGFTQEMSSVKGVGSEFGGAAMPSQELSDLHSAIVSSLDRFEKELDDQNQFLMDVAHEFRTPVASIRMKIDVDTKKSSVSPDDFFSLCQSVDRSTTRLEQLLAKLNSLPKLGSHIQVSDVRLSTLVT